MKMKFHRCPRVSLQYQQGFLCLKHFDLKLEKQLFADGAQLFRSNSLPCCLHQPSLWYHSSAVLALALDALTLPYRMRNNSTPMWQVAETLAVSGRKVAPCRHCCYYDMEKKGSVVVVTRAVCVLGGGCLRSGPLPHDARHVSPRCSECLQRSVALEAAVSLPRSSGRPLLRPARNT